MTAGDQFVHMERLRHAQDSTDGRTLYENATLDAYIYCEQHCKSDAFLFREWLNKVRALYVFDQRIKDRLAEFKARSNGASAPRAPLLVEGNEFMASIKPPEYVVRPLAQRGQLVSLTGRTGHGKSTVSCMVIAGCLTGRPIGSLTFRKCRVLLLAGENPSNAALQLQGALRHYGVTYDELKQLSVRSGAGQLADIGGPIFDEAAAKGEHGLVVIDTSAAFFSYDDENDNIQALQHGKDARSFTLLPGEPCVWMPCHPVKGATRENLIPRGGGALHNEVDGNLTAWNDSGIVTVANTKLRGPEFDPLTLRLSPVDIGLVDDEGAPIRPLVAMPLSELEEVNLARERTERENAVLSAILRFPDHSLRNWCRDAGLMSEKGHPQTSSLQDILERLTADKLVSKYRDRTVLTDAGKREAERVSR